MFAQRIKNIYVYICATKAIMLCKKDRKKVISPKQSEDDKGIGALL